MEIPSTGHRVIFVGGLKEDGKKGVFFGGGKKLNKQNG